MFERTWQSRESANGPSFVGLNRTHFSQAGTMMVESGAFGPFGLLKPRSDDGFPGWLMLIANPEYQNVDSFSLSECRKGKKRRMSD